MPRLYVLALAAAIAASVPALLRAADAPRLQNQPVGQIVSVGPPARRVALRIAPGAMGAGRAIYARTQTGALVVLHIDRQQGELVTASVPAGFHALAAGDAVFQPAD